MFGYSSEEVGAVWGEGAWKNCLHEGNLICWGAVGEMFPMILLALN